MVYNSTHGGRGPGNGTPTGARGAGSNDAREEESRGNRTIGIVPPVLRTPSGLRQAPSRDGPNRRNKKERLAAEETIQSQRVGSNLEGIHKFEWDQTKGVTDKERKILGFVY